MRVAMYSPSLPLCSRGTVLVQLAQWISHGHPTWNMAHSLLQPPPNSSRRRRLKAAPFRRRRNQRQQAEPMLLPVAQARHPVTRFASTVILFVPVLALTCQGCTGMGSFPAAPGRNHCGCLRPYNEAAASRSNCALIDETLSPALSHLPLTPGLRDEQSAFSRRGKDLVHSPGPRRAAASGRGESRCDTRGSQPLTWPASRATASTQGLGTWAPPSPPALSPIPRPRRASRSSPQAHPPISPDSVWKDRETPPPPFR